MITPYSPGGVTLSRFWTLSTSRRSFSSCRPTLRTTTSAGLCMIPRTPRIAQLSLTRPTAMSRTSFVTACMVTSCAIPSTGNSLWPLAVVGAAATTSTSSWLSSSRFFGVAALVSAIQAVRCVSALKYDGLANAPKLPPFAMAQIDIMKSSEMWAEAPLAMTDTLQRFAEIVRKHISATKGYEAQAVGGGYLIANRSSTKIMRMFEGIRQDVQKESWPTEVLGAQGNCRDRSSLSFSAPTTLLIRLTAHYCKAVDILFDPSTKSAALQRERRVLLGSAPCSI